MNQLPTKMQPATTTSTRHFLENDYCIKTKWKESEFLATSQKREKSLG